MCSVTACSHPTNLSIQNTAQIFRSKFGFWRKSNAIVPNQQTVNKWRSTDAFENLLSEFSQTLSLSLETEGKVHRLFVEEKDALFWWGIGLSVTLIPLNLIVLILILRKYLLRVSRLVSEAEELFLEFPVHVLVENTYLTSYFNSKAKNGK